LELVGGDERRVDHEAEQAIQAALDGPLMAGRQTDDGRGPAVLDWLDEHGEVGDFGVRYAYCCRHQVDD
jgi:hypothetical protein